jgi:hypothetical protein
MCPSGADNLSEQHCLALMLLYFMDYDVFFNLEGEIDVP